MHPQNDVLTKFTLLAKNFVYDAGRFKHLLNMMGTVHGAVMAVHTVIGAIEQAMPVPPAIVHQLGFNVYCLLADMAEQVTKVPADPAKMRMVTAAIMHATNQVLAGGAKGKAPAAKPVAAVPVGIIAMARAK